MHVQVEAKSEAKPIVEVDQTGRGGIIPLVVEADEPNKRAPVQPAVDVQDVLGKWQKLHILSYGKLREKVDYTRQHLSRLEKLGLFPCRIQVGGNKVGWLEHEVDEWIMRRAAERGAA